VEFLGIDVTGDVLSASFSFSDISPLDFGEMSVGDVIYGAQVLIETAFDDAAASLSLGLVSAPGSILPSNTIDPPVVGTYGCDEVFSCGSGDAVRLQILPGTSTQGSGRVIIAVRRA
jgi:hypothetical protein